MRSGVRCLSIFAHALNARVLRAHAGGPLHSGELAETIGWAPHSSLRAAVKELVEAGALEGGGSGAGRGAGDQRLTEAGRALLPIADALERWLAEGPDGPTLLDTAAAQGILRVLIAAWDSSMIRALAVGPATLADLNAGIRDVNYPAMKRRLAKLRSTRLVTPVQTSGGKAYEASDWLRRAVVPLILAGRWERLHAPSAEPITAVEIEAAFLFATPLVDLPASVAGECTLAVFTGAVDGFGNTPLAAGVRIEVQRGRVAACTVGASAHSDTWVLGTAEAWFDAVIENDGEALRVGGAAPGLGKGIVSALNGALFPSP